MQHSFNQKFIGIDNIFSTVLDCIFSFLYIFSRCVDVLCKYVFFIVNKFYFPTMIASYRLHLPVQLWQQLLTPSPSG